MEEPVEEKEMPFIPKTGVVVHEGGSHYIVCPGDGIHYWVEKKWNEKIKRERVFRTNLCSEWKGECPGRKP